MKLTGHHVRGRTPRQLLEDFVDDLVEASYQGQIGCREFLELRQVLSAQADGLEEALRRRATFGAFREVLQDPRPARGKQKAKTVKGAVPAREARPPAERPEALSRPTASAPEKKQRKKVTLYLGSGHCELCTTMWPDDWRPALTGRGQFRCLGCKQVLDVGLRREPTRAGMKPVPVSALTISSAAPASRLKSSPARTTSRGPRWRDGSRKRSGGASTAGVFP
ncbi:MAG: hypothetical protein HY814_00310 [Candidatus Riflebacteria bacterium]|nr:hypothetical protein [Candidatus Riflebacteria bacterium]